MTNIEEIEHKILALAQNDQSGKAFDKLAIDVFHYQYANCSIYRSFCELLNVSPSDISSIRDIPSLPISFFKTHKVTSGSENFDVVFRSSRTTGQTPSQHFVRKVAWYNNISRLGFESYYGPIADYVFFGLLPGYLERSDSSLVHMVQYFGGLSEPNFNRFYLDRLDDLINDIQNAKASGRKIILIGVSFALLDLAEQVKQIDWNDVIVMETGGMKGRKKEIIRSELHDRLIKAFNVKSVHSEYGMTELLSQAYASKNGILKPINTMKVLPGQLSDPLSYTVYGQQCQLRIIDLANIYSCSFLSTEDIGRVYTDGSFEVLGRMDNSEVRGCNLLYTEKNQK